MTIKAIIFDVDGTLADTEDGHRLSFNKAFAENGLDWNWDVALYDKLLKVTGGKERIKHFVETCLPDFDKPADYDGFVKNLHMVKTGHYNAMLREGGIPLRPGIKQLISDAHAAGITLAIATTTTPENVSTLLEVGLGRDWQKHFAALAAATSCRTRNPRRISTSGCWTSWAFPPPTASRWKTPRMACAPASRRASEPTSR
jgi:phosphoglycolate phosphatase-like HAD superfamily hydrolase